MDQPGQVVNPAHGQPNRENEHFPLHVIVASRICAESADCLGSATTVVGTGRVFVLQVYILLRRVLKLDERTLAHRVNQLT